MDLRHTDTNAADDSKGRAFGLDGDLYLPVVVAVVVALALYSLLGLVAGLGSVVAAGIAGAPLGLTLLWAVVLRNGRPPAHDRDTVGHWLSGGDFTRSNGQQRGLVEL